MMNLINFLAETTEVASLNPVGAGLAALGAGLAVFTGAFVGMAEGNVARQAVEGVSRNPEAVDDIRSTMILGIALTETTGIYGLLIAFLIIFIIGMPLTA